MRYTTSALFLAAAVFVTQPAMAVNSSYAQMQTTINAAGPVKVTPPSPMTCVGALETYFGADTADDALHDVMEACLKLSERKVEGMNLKVPAPKKISELPSKAAVERAVRSMEKEANKLVEKAAKEIPDLDVLSQLDFLACGLQLPGVKCEDGRFLPASGLVRSVLTFGLRLFGQDQKIEMAYSMFHDARRHKVKALLSMAEMVKILASDYPATENEFRDWVKSYRLVSANVQIATKMLDIPLLKLKVKEPAMVVGGAFRTTV